MAVTYITRIYATIDNSIDYIIRDKVVLEEIDIESEEDFEIKGDKVVLKNNAMKQQLGNEALKSANDYLENALDYIERDKELESQDGKAEIKKTLTSSVNCRYDIAKEQFKVLRDCYEEENKIDSSGYKRGVSKGDKEILGYHIWQSFEEKIDESVANEIGVKLVNELYGDYQCVISTHNNTAHTHNHIVFNAVSLIPNEKGQLQKYNICTENTRRLREVSDRLCEEYGLSVLHHTKDMNLKWYKDEAGNWKCFEPTERKSKVEKGQYTTKNDYRNYEAYRKSEEFKSNQREVIRYDIDRFISHSESLEDLIRKLEDIGYEVKNYNSTGGELKYISFKSPTGESFIRGKENSLGADYTRESIVRRIEEINKEKQKIISSEARKTDVQEQPQKKTYTYSNVNIEDIDEEKRKRYNRSKNVEEWVKRSGLERYIIADTKIINKRVDEIYKQAEYKMPIDKKYYGKKAKHYEAIDRINENLQALQFLENKNIQSFQQINDTVQSLYEKNNEINLELGKIRDYLKEMNTNIVLLRQYNDLKHSISINSSNPDYVSFEMQGEKALLEQYEQIIKAKHLIDPDKQIDYITKFEEWNKKYEELAMAKERINRMINQYDLTVKTIDRIDREYDRKYRMEIKEYYDINKDNKQEESKKNKTKRYLQK